MDTLSEPQFNLSVFWFIVFSLVKLKKACFDLMQFKICKMFTGASSPPHPLQCAVGTTGQKSISRVIEYLEHC